jgi:hypothetical protein
MYTQNKKRPRPEEKYDQNKKSKHGHNTHKKDSVIQCIQNAFKKENQNPLKTLSNNWKANDGNLIGYTLILLKKNKISPPSDVANCVLDLILSVKSSEKDTETPKNISIILAKLGQFIDDKNYRTILRKKLQENKERQKLFQGNILFLLEQSHKKIESKYNQKNFFFEKNTKTPNANISKNKKNTEFRKENGNFN